ncbi:MAG TPA: ABC transporter permease [Kiloniellales bacterium]|jgi:NitT/TauT family transport system permease protein
MTRRLDYWCALATVLTAGALVFPIAGGDAPLNWWDVPILLSGLLVFLLAVAWFAGRGPQRPRDNAVLLAAVVVGCAASLSIVHGHAGGHAALGVWLLVLGLWAAAWRGLDGIAGLRSLKAGRQRLIDLSVPVVFGLWLVFLWEVGTVGFGVPQVLLPAPSVIAVRIAGSLAILAADFQQTFMKAVLIGYVIGCATGFLVAVLVDRVPFLQRGLLPLGNLVSALPIVGIAPIMVMWFGFDWPSKAAVVVIMTFFPMLVNTVTGLATAGTQDRELMRSYAAGYWQTLFKLRLPAALPFVFNALKINSTLAMIGAIVAEFFGTPIVGMGFRISTEVGRMNVDMVWAEIVMAALAGSAFYAVMALTERAFTFWHPSYRERR